MARAISARSAAIPKKKKPEPPLAKASPPVPNWVGTAGASGRRSGVTWGVLRASPPPPAKELPIRVLEMDASGLAIVARNCVIDDHAGAGAACAARCREAVPGAS
jgi:hypothetical protein